jgi:hypothetical protein
MEVADLAAHEDAADLFLEQLAEAADQLGDTEAAPDRPAGRST